MAGFEKVNWDHERDCPRAASRVPPAADGPTDSYYPENYNGKVRGHSYLDGAIGQCSVPTPISEVSQSLGNAQNALDRLAKSLAALEHRLSPALRAESPQKEGSSPQEVTTCGLHDAVVSIERRVLTAARIVEALTDRLAL